MMPQQDIYPLGMNHGLLADILNFALNNIYQYGQRAKASNQQLGQGMSTIASGGQANLSPMIRDVLNVAPMMAGPLGPKLSPEELRMAESAPRANRTWITDADLTRQAAGETLPPLGSALPDIPRSTSSPGGLEYFQELSRKLGLAPPAPEGVPPVPTGSPLTSQVFEQQLRELQKLIPGFEPKISQNLLGR